MGEPRTERRNASPLAHGAARARLARPRAPGRGTPAFTLVELIVVVILMAILAAAVVPRLTGNTGRRAEAEAKAVQTLLTGLAQRDALVAGGQIALEYDADTRALSVWSLRRDPTAAGDAIGYAAAAWQADRFLPPVALEVAEIAAAQSDGVPLDRRRWRVAFAPGQRPPSLSMIVRARDGKGPAWEVALAPEESSARRVAASASALPTLAAGRTVDLDAAGKGEAPW